MDSVSEALADLLLLVPFGSTNFYKGSSNVQEDFFNSINLTLEGKYGEVVNSSVFGSWLANPRTLQITKKYPDAELRTVLGELTDHLAFVLPPESCQLLAISFLQLFLQGNFTGPKSEVSLSEVYFTSSQKQQLQLDAIKLLGIEGNCAYDLINEPLLLVFSLLIFERLQGISKSLVSFDMNSTLEDIVEETTGSIRVLDTQNTALNASLLWWRARALQVHLSVLAEPSDIVASVSSALLGSDIVKSFLALESLSENVRRQLRLSFLLENARNGIHAQTEHLAEPFMYEAAAVSRFLFVLTGANAKRTKFQTFNTACLILLAKSHDMSVDFKSDDASVPEVFELNSDLLLEKPHYESLSDVTDIEEPDVKRTKLDNPSFFDQEEKRLIPICLKSGDIPTELKSLDPNNQPALSDLDNIQLLLRLTILRQTSPVGSVIAEEELQAIVNRIVYSSSNSINWSIFGRALWERSVLETNKSRTVERGILQMTSLVEEIGINVKSNMIPHAKESSDKYSIAASRLRFIHQLPLMASWTMNSKLAEKYMSLGVLKSAIEIYLRLNLTTEAALCYAAVGEENQAENLLTERLASHPDDARALSILGDIRQDPSLWERAWQVGKYAKAKASLSRYYYKPPPSSNLKRDYSLAIHHMQDCLKASPLSFDNWYLYGCYGLESEDYDLASEAFTRCVSLDDTNSHAWSNLASALLKTGKTKQAFTALKRALQQGEGAKRSWRIFENYLLVAAKLGEWNDVLHATKELINLRKSNGTEVPVDIMVIEKLSQILVQEPYQEEQRAVHFQTSCIDLICNILPSVINHSARLWRIVSRVELWRKKAWAALDCFEKAYRATIQRPDLETDIDVWNEAVEACSDLVSAYESLGDLPGKHDAGDVVCKDWKFKARSSIRTLMSKGKAMWEDSEGWNRLVTLKEELSSS